MSEMQRRKAANEALFREVNEQITSVKTQLSAAEPGPLHIICECDRSDCMEGINVPRDVYEHVRRESVLFLVFPSHEDPQVEDVVDTGSDFLIVRKRPGEPAAIARDTDPRT